jgi:ornithine--oxo-acid transaminase
VVSFSTDPVARRNFGPFTPGFDVVPFADAQALERAITPSTVAVLLEPIQGEAGVYVPPDGYLRDVREICDRHKVLFVADEIQSGLGRTGATFACDYDSIRPDMYVLGKALGGGVVPVSAVVADRDVLGVLRPGEHGSTFGGNPLACAVARQVIRMLSTGEYQLRARALGARMHAGLDSLVGSGLLEVRGRGLWAGLDIDPALGTGRDICERLLHHQVLARDTHGSTIRLAPPLIIEADEVDWLVDQLARALADAARG